MNKIIRKTRVMEPETIEKNEGSSKSRTNRIFCKIFCLLLTLDLTSTVVFANPVDLQRAKQVGQSFLKTRPKMQRGNKALQFNLVKTEKATINKVQSNGSILRSAASEEMPMFYVFNNDGGGFVIVSGDDRVKPVLGYSETNSFDPNNIPPNTAAWLDGYKEQIRYVIENDIATSDEIQKEWSTVEAGTNLNMPASTQASAPLIQTQWNQSPYYNNLCPYDYSVGARTITGCVATAMAQVMNYWQYPTTGTGSHSYNPANSSYGTLFADFGNTIYDWNNMPNALTSLSSPEQIKAVATLMYHCGVSIDMNYGLNGSVAGQDSPVQALQTYFGYKPTIQSIYKDSYSSADWIMLLKAEIDAKRPVIYGGGTDDGAGRYINGHSFIFDGYDDNDNFHINWGWGGWCDDAYYTVDALNPYPPSYTFNYQQEAIIGIVPADNPVPVYTISISSNPFMGGWTKGIQRAVGSYLSGEFCMVTAQANGGYSFVNWTENGVEVSIDACYTFTVLADRNLVANFKRNPWEIGYPNAADVTATLDNGTLTISGTGAVQSNNSVAPWYSEKDNITNVVINNSVTNIGQGYFYNCSNLASVSIPNSLTSIDSYAFCNCSNLTSVSIPNNLTNIGQWAFYGCTGLTNVTVNWATPLSIDNTAFDGVNLSNITLNTPAGTQCEYVNAPVWQNFNIVKQSQTIDFPEIPAKTYGDAPVTLPPTSDAGLAISYQSSNTEVATISGNILTIEGAGTADITATQTGDCAYGAATSVTRTLTVNAPATYGISIGSFSGGKVTTDKTSAIAGETVTLTITPDTCTPDTCYKLDTISVYNTNNPATSVALRGSENTRTFTMPTYGVTVIATFEKANAIDDVVANQLSIFPNPVKGDIFIKSDLPIEKVEIYSLTGNLLLLENNFNEKISVSALWRGVYLLKVYINKGVAVSKIVKE